MSNLYPKFTFEITNFDTQGDRVLDLSLKKIGEKGLFTKELEDALMNGTIDFVVHSLKDLPCQQMPADLILCGIPKREDPSDSLVVAEHWRNIKFDLDDFDSNSVIGTSSNRRVAQLKLKYPHLRFESIRGNLQTRFNKLDNPKCSDSIKYDAIILATAGLKRMSYADRITKILSNEICMYAVGQGALGIECRRNDLELIKMINEINDEETVLTCIAERTFLARLEGGCSAPIGVNSKVINSESICLEACVIDLESKNKIHEKFEIKFNDSTNEMKYLKCFSFILDNKIDEKKMIIAEVCGLNLAEKFKKNGAYSIIKDWKYI